METKWLHVPQILAELAVTLRGTFLTQTVLIVFQHKTNSLVHGCVVFFLILLRKMIKKYRKHDDDSYQCGINQGLICQLSPFLDHTAFWNMYVHSVFVYIFHNN